MHIRPIGARLLVRQASAEEKTKGGIFLPEGSKEQPNEAEVIAVGKGTVLANGEISPVCAKVGDRILFGKFSGQQIEIDNEKYLILKEEEILAIIKK